MLKNPQKCFPLIVLLVIVATTTYGLKVYLKRNIERNVDLWKIYRNSEGGYELKYPPNWYVSHWYFGEKDCSVSCEDSPDPSSCKQSCLKDFCVQNKKEVYVMNPNSITRFLPYSITKILVGPGPVTKKGSLFRFGPSGRISKYPTIKSMEDWIMRRDEISYHPYEQKEFIHPELERLEREEYEREKEDYMRRARESRQKEIENLVEMEVGNIKTKVSIHRVNSYTWRLNFIYDGKFYEMAYMSGSPKQFEKDKGIFEEIIDSLRIY